MSTGVISARSSAARRCLILLLAFTVALVGLSVTPMASAAAATPSVTGRGAETSDLVRLPAGIYRVELVYDHNIGDSGPTNFVAALNGSTAQAKRTLASDLATDNKQRRIIELTKAADVWVDVSVAGAAASWRVTFQKLAETTGTVSSLAVIGTGANSDSLYRLKAGTYLATVTYRGNGSGDEDAFELSLVGKGGSRQSLVDATGNGSRSRNLTIATTGTFWLSLAAAGDAEWSVTLTPAAKLSKVPTPTISGTAKVGRTLTAKPGTWKPSGVKLGYQWKRGGKTISGATKASYTLTSSDKGKKITVTVTGSKLGYVMTAKTSTSTGAVKK